MQAYIGSVWVIASVAGPVSAGTLVEFVSWRWVFWINVPLCLLTAWMLARGFHESVERRRRRIDVLGASLLASSVACLLISVLQGGISWPWLSWQTVALVGGFIVFAVAFRESIRELDYYRRAGFTSEPGPSSDDAQLIASEVIAKWESRL